MSTHHSQFSNIIVPRINLRNEIPFNSPDGARALYEKLERELFRTTDVSVPLKALRPEVHEMRLDFIY